MLDRKKVLLTSLSPTPRPTTYYLNNNYATANQSPIALLQLLDKDDFPDEIFILCTDKISKGQFPEVSKEIVKVFNDKGINFNENNIKDIPIGDKGNYEELWETLTIILNSIPPNVDLTLDITHSFRHFPFIYFTAAIFMQALRGVTIKGIYYGMFIEDDAANNMLDLSLILDMVEWFYAVRTFKETGQASHLINMLDSLQKPPEGLSGKDQFVPYGKVKGLLRALTDFNYAYAQALPLEVGIHSMRIEKHLGEMEFTEVMKTRVPIPEELISSMGDFIIPFSVKNLVDNADVKKKDLPLDRVILEQQANIITAYLQQGYIHHAVGIMREWLVSIALMYNRNSTDTNISWLDFGKVRSKIENQLNVLGKVFASGEKMNLTYEQGWLAEIWHKVQDMRNSLAHHGYREQNVLFGEKKLKEIEDLLNNVKGKLGDSSWWQIDFIPETTYKIILLSPLGLSKGLLFSAIKHTKPDFVVVITSERSQGFINEIMLEAECNAEYMMLSMKEPFSGFVEVKEITEKVKPLLLQGDELIINITGGTTAMQFIVQEIADNVKNIISNTKTIALVDRRSPEEQRANPYIKGEIVFLDDIGKEKEG